MTSGPIPFRINIDDVDLRHLRERLTHARRALAPPGAPTAAAEGPADQMQHLARFWHQDFDWRRAEARLNEIPQFVASVDNLNVHFVHAPSPHKNATPLLLTHGPSGSFAEFIKVIPALTDPVSYGGRAEDAFHVVIPSLPGFAFSGTPREPGWDISRTAYAWRTLMSRLAYEHYLVAGSEVGARVSLALAAIDDAVVGVHMNFSYSPPPLFAADIAVYTYALSDSPLDHLSWFYDRLSHGASPNEGVPDLSPTEILTQVSLSWFTKATRSCAQFNLTNVDSPPEPFSTCPPLQTAVGLAVYGHDHASAAEALAGCTFPNVIDSAKHPVGSHLAALEHPETFVRDLRRFRGLTTKHMTLG